MGIDIPAIRPKYLQGPNCRQRSEKLANFLDPRRGFKSQSYREVMYFDPSRNLGHHQTMDWTDVLQKHPSEIVMLDGYFYARTRDGVFRTKMPMTARPNPVSENTSGGTKHREKELSASEYMRKELRGKYGALGLARLDRIKDQVHEAVSGRRLQSQDGFPILFGLLKGLHEDQINYINFMGGVLSQFEQRLYEIKDTGARLRELHRAEAQIREFASHLSPDEMKGCEDFLAELTTCIMMTRYNPNDDPDLKWLSH